LLEVTREMKAAAAAKDVQEFFSHDFRSTTGSGAHPATRFFPACFPS